MLLSLSTESSLSRLHLGKLIDVKSDWVNAKPSSASGIKQMRGQRRVRKDDNLRTIGHNEKIGFFKSVLGMFYGILAKINNTTSGCNRNYQLNGC